MKTLLMHYSKGGQGRWFTISPITPRFITGLIVFGLLLAVAPITSSLATPYTPMSKNQVLLTLPASMVTLRRAQQALPRTTEITIENNKRDSQFADRLQQAQTYLYSAQQNNDPRWYGYAHASLAPWWKESQRYPKVALLKATILQHRHQFPEALIELNSVLQQQPRNIQALLIRAQVNMMQANYHAAQQDCQHILWLSNPTLGINCIAQVNGLTGQGLHAIVQLTALLSNRKLLTDLERAEIHTTIATIAHRHQRKALALSHYQQAYAINPNNSYLIEQFSDYLVEQKYTKRLLALLANTGGNNINRNLEQKIKMAQHYQQVDDVQFEPLKTELAKHFDEAKIRNGIFPHKEFSIFSLTVSYDYNQALVSALDNWAIQKSPSDALLVLRSAIASQQFQQANPVIQWATDTRVYDHRIESLINSINNHRASL